MWSSKSAVTVVGCLYLALVLVVHTGEGQRVVRVLCYYDGANGLAEAPGKATLADIESALSSCTHLVYGYGTIDPKTQKVVSRNPSLDLDSGKGNYRQVVQLKRKYPTLKVFLGIGGYHHDGSSQEYLDLLESSGGQINFVNSVYDMMRNYSFDGIDLAWRFNRNKPIKIHSTPGKIWSGFKKVFTGDRPVDDRADVHRGQFTSLLRELKKAFLNDGLQMGITVLPHVNASIFMDIPAIINYLDYVSIASYDMQTPERNPKEADFSAPLYEPTERVAGNNVDGLVKHWIYSNAPASKLVVGIPTFARGWKLTKDSRLTGVPPLAANGPSPGGSQLRQDGFYSWSEVCAMLPNAKNRAMTGEHAPLLKTEDPTKRFGSYAYRMPNEKGNDGLWISYEDPTFAENKASYVRLKGLGGIGINDLAFDDFKATCSTDAFPILRTAARKLKT